jgi:DNA polymerase-3 subunit alpha
VPAGYFRNFRVKNQGDSAYWVKAYQLKEASDAIRQQFGEKQTATVSKQELSENKKVLVDTDFVHLHNHTQFSVLQSTISIAQLVKAASKKNACSCHDGSLTDGAFHFVRDILNHNKG